MKLKYISVICFLAGASAYGQVKTNQIATPETSSNAFLDASENTDGQATSVGKGLLFPQTDLSTFKLDINAADGVNYPTYFDGMIVYNTKEGGSTTDTNIQTTDNLQKGFYYFSNPKGKTNGNITNSKWIKLSDTQANDQLWAQRDNNGVTETYLKPADANGDLVSYQGNRKLYNKLGEFNFNGNTFNLGTDLTGIKDIPNLNLITSDVLPNQAKLAFGNPFSFAKTYVFNGQASEIKQSHVQTAQNTKSISKSYAAGASVLFTDKDVTGNLDFLLGYSANVNINSNATIQQMVGVGSNPTVGDFLGSSSPVAEVISGATLYPSSLANSRVTSLYGITAIPIAYKSTNDYIIGVNTIAQSGSKFWYDTQNGGSYPATTLKHLLGVKSSTEALPNSTIDVLASSFNLSTYNSNSSVTHGYGILNKSDFGTGATVKDFSSYETFLDVGGNVNMDTFAVFKFFKNAAANLDSFNPKNMYGLWLDNINNGTNSNYAIYTNAGKVRFGDFQQSGAGDRIVVADDNGILKAGSSVASIASSLEPWREAVTNNPATTNDQNIYQMGNVGVGTTSPTSKLDVKTTDMVISQFGTTSNRAIIRLLPENNVEKRFSVETNSVDKKNSFIWILCR
ncbi:hypothetical protein [Riemerella anatipestifer]|uniref:hypothetical protein n=1 Tax=Riemerella anatipestifer TaxID=34085 RepID=UPI0006996CA1|nr:hypothetical protein [Riemerella anatipestifer]